MSCTEIIAFYEKYRTNNCSGPIRYPDTVAEFVNIYSNLGDDWDQQIACVLTGKKIMAMTDYDQYNTPEDIEDYYSIKPKDIQLRKDVINCGVKRLYDNRGTEYYVYPKYLKNAEILIGINNGTIICPHGYLEVIRSLLLGYSYESFILYMLFNEGGFFRIKDNFKLYQAQYKQMIDKYIQSYTPVLDHATHWILDNGGIIN